MNFHHQLARRAIFLTAAINFSLAASSGLAQDAPDKPQPEIKIVPTSINKEAGWVSVPGAFWNEMKAIWIEVAFCGNPSDFLHETIVCASVTRDDLLKGLHIAGLRDADAWVDNPADFPRLRGDRVLITVEVTKDGKTESFSLDEMIAFRGWNVSVGPYGWMFKGEPGKIAATPPATAPATATAPAANISDAMRILTDDPQVALQFRGLQHQSRSFLDYPLAYDEWAFPDFDYVRNMLIEPKILALPKADPKEVVPGESPQAAHHRQLRDFWTHVYNSNGAVAVKIIFKHVNEEQFLTETAQLWHDDGEAKRMTDQLETARHIDTLKAEWLTLLPKVRKMAADARIADPEKPIAQSPEFLRMALLAAMIENDYAKLDAAWGIWAADHTVFDEDPTEIDEMKAQAKAWREHMELNREHAQQELNVEQALVDAAVIQQKPDSPENRRALQKANGMEIEARSRAMLASNKQALEVFQARKDKLDPNDPRVEMCREINTNLALSKARDQAATTGIAYGKALQSGDAAAISAAQDAYKKAALAMTLAGLEVKLANVEFDISKRDGFDDDDELKAFKKEREVLLNQIVAAKSAATRP